MTGRWALLSTHCAAAALFAFFVAGCDNAPPPPEKRAAPDLPPARAARFVKFEEVTELTASAWAAIAEFNLIDSTGTAIDRSQWKATADSTAANAAPENAIDGDPKSLWHTKWEGPDAPPMPPHWLVISLGRRAKISGFRYLPRQDGSINGAIAKYRLFVSDDGVNWGEPVASGDFTNDRPATAEKTVVFGSQSDNRAPVVESLPAQNSAMSAAVSVQVKATDADDDLLTYTATGLPAGLSVGPNTGLVSGTPITAGSFPVQLSVTDGKSPPATMTVQWTVQAPAIDPGAAAVAPGEVRFVKLEALSEVTGKPFSSVAEFNVIGADGLNVTRKDWSVSADSADSIDPASAAIDGNPATQWHSQWNGAAPPPPHSFVVDMKRPMRVTGFKVLPRQDASTNGVIGRFNFYVSVDGVDWGKPVAEGDFATMGAMRSEKTVRLR